MRYETTHIGLACNCPRGVTACWAVLTWMHVSRQIACECVTTHDKYECNRIAKPEELNLVREMVDALFTSMRAMQTFATMGKLLIYSDFFNKVDESELGSSVRSH